MNKPYRRLSSTTALILLAASATAQADIPMKPWGKPSLQGNWDFRTITPLYSSCVFCRSGVPVRG